jgi:DNA-binding YbaB/EbfC family protein
LRNQVFTAKSGGGLVSASMNGNGEVVDVSLDDSLLSDKESLQILLISAINDVSKMVEDDKKFATAQMLSSMGGFGTKS